MEENPSDSTAIAATMKDYVEPSIQEAFATLWTNQACHDSVLKCSDGVEMGVNRCALAVRSSPFAEMCLAKKTSDGTVIIDCHYPSDIMKAVAEYIHTGTVAQLLDVKTAENPVQEDKINAQVNHHDEIVREANIIFQRIQSQVKLAAAAVHYCLPGLGQQIYHHLSNLLQKTPSIAFALLESWHQENNQQPQSLPPPPKKLQLLAMSSIIQSALDGSNAAYSINENNNYLSQDDVDDSILLKILRLWATPSSSASSAQSPGDEDRLSLATKLVKQYNNRLQKKIFDPKVISSSSSHSVEPSGLATSTELVTELPPIKEEETEKEENPTTSETQADPRSLGSERDDSAHKPEELAKQESTDCDEVDDLTQALPALSTPLQEQDAEDHAKDDDESGEINRKDDELEGSRPDESSGTPSTAMTTPATGTDVASPDKATEDEVAPSSNENMLKIAATDAVVTLESSIAEENTDKKPPKTDADVADTSPSLVVSDAVASDPGREDNTAQTQDIESVALEVDKSATVGTASALEENLRESLTESSDALGSVSADIPDEQEIPDAVENEDDVATDMEPSLSPERSASETPITPPVSSTDEDASPVAVAVATSKDADIGVRLAGPESLGPQSTGIETIEDQAAVENKTVNPPISNAMTDSSEQPTSADSLLSGTTGRNEADVDAALPLDPGNPDAIPGVPCIMAASDRQSSSHLQADGAADSMEEVERVDKSNLSDKIEPVQNSCDKDDNLVLAKCTEPSEVKQEKELFYQTDSSLSDKVGALARILQFEKDLVRSAEQILESLVNQEDTRANTGSSQRQLPEPGE